jgi:hypothetical protein
MCAEFTSYSVRALPLKNVELGHLSNIKNFSSSSNKTQVSLLQGPTDEFCSGK